MEEKKFECVVMISPCPKFAHVNRCNGYVAFDSKCPWYTNWTIDLMDYEEIKCNGGITYVHRLKRDDLKDWEIVNGNPENLEDNIIVIGFDTLHSWDTDEKWPREKVIAEAHKIKEQLYTQLPNFREF